MAFYFVSTFATAQTPTKQRPYGLSRTTSPRIRSPWLAASETGPLRPSQESVLTEWFQSRKDEKNNIIKLHTGEGKTLIGLLLLHSKINSGEGPCLYVCPNKYLAEQVRQEAQKFGIPICEITNQNDLPDEFHNGSKILITHVQKVFNGRTIFGLANKSITVGSIVLDDSHACIDSIKDSLTIKVNKGSELYNAAIKLFEDDIKEQGEGSFLEIESGDYNTMLPIPYWSWYEKRDEITKAILRNIMILPIVQTKFSKN
jgi:superfamily II DNA or RNA helicase